MHPRAIGTRGRLRLLAASACSRLRARSSRWGRPVARMRCPRSRGSRGTPRSPYRTPRAPNTPPRSARCWHALHRPAKTFPYIIVQYNSLHTATGSAHFAAKRDTSDKSAESNRVRSRQPLRRYPFLRPGSTGKRRIRRRLRARSSPARRPRSLRSCLPPAAGGLKGEGCANAHDSGT